MIIGGEDQDVYVFDGVPFKHAKTISQHVNFVNKVAFRPDGKLFVTVSSDKSVILFDSETLEPIRKIEKAHTKGIMDVNWVDEETIVTCSTDNEVKFWNTEQGVEVRSLSVNLDGKEKVENQQLGLITTPDQTFTVSLNSNINVWTKPDLESGVKAPSYVVQGHSVSLYFIHLLKLFRTTFRPSSTSTACWSLRTRTARSSPGRPTLALRSRKPASSQARATPSM